MLKLARGEQDQLLDFLQEGELDCCCYGAVRLRCLWSRCRCQRRACAKFCGRAGVVCKTCPFVCLAARRGAPRHYHPG